MYVSDDNYNNDDDDPIELDAEQVYSRRAGKTPIIEEVGKDDIVKVDAEQVYSWRASKEHSTHHPSEDKAISDSNDNEGGNSGGSSLEDEA